MDPTVQQQLLDGLKGVATKLGDSAGHLWELAVRQQYLNGIENLIWAAASVVGIIVCVRIIQRVVKENYWDGLDVCLPAIGVVFLAVGLICFITNAIDCIANPQYQAFLEIVRAITGK